MMLQAAVSLLNIGGYRLGSPPRPGRARRRAAGAARRDLEQVRDAIDGVARAAADPRAHAARASCARCATRSPSCRWPTRARPQAQPPAGASRPAQAPPAPAEGRAPAARGAAGGAAERARARRSPAARLWVPGTLSRRGGLDGAGAQRGCVEAWATARRPPFAAGTIDCAARLRRVGARLCERSGRQMCARRSSRGTPIRPRRISVEQLSDEPWGRRRPRLRRLRRGLRPA